MTALAYDQSVGHAVQSRLTGRAALGALALAAALVMAPAARAQGPEFVPLASGAFPHQALTWQASAVRPNTIFLDLYNREGALFQTYAPQFTTPPPPKRVTALGYRPGGLPTASALVGGVGGTRVKQVKVFFSGAPLQKLRTVKAPSEWGFAGRFFAAGAIVPPEHAGTTQVAFQIKALDGKGRRLSIQRSIFTNPF
jgi:hypothetical protein